MKGARTAPFFLDKEAASGSSADFLISAGNDYGSLPGRPETTA
jgi:hypothetical protein